MTPVVFGLDMLYSDSNHKSGELHECSCVFVQFEQFVVPKHHQNSTNVTQAERSNSAIAARFKPQLLGLC